MFVCAYVRQRVKKKEKYVCVPVCTYVCVCGLGEDASEAMWAKTRAMCLGQGLLWIQQCVPQQFIKTDIQTDRQTAWQDSGV